MASKAELFRRIVGGRPRVRGLLESAAWFILIGSAASLLDTWGWPWELPAHFRFQAAIALAASAIVWMALRCWRRVILFGATAAMFWLLCGAPSWRLRERALPSPGDVFRICSFNVHTENRDFAATLDFLRREKFDAVFLMEIDSRWRQSVELLRDFYAFIEAEPREDNFGVAFLSRRAPEKSGVIYIGNAGVPSIEADFGRLRLIGTHPLPPGNRDTAALRNDQLGALAATIKGATNLVLVGDLNCAPWTAPFRKFERDGGLFDTSPGFGWQPTWPAFAPAAFRIPIDHALVSSGLVCVTRSVGPYLGSDHRPLIIQIAAPPR